MMNVNNSKLLALSTVLWYVNSQTNIDSQTQKHKPIMTESENTADQLKSLQEILLKPGISLYFAKQL